MILAAVANTTASTAATQNGLDIGDYTGIGALAATAITFALTYRHGTQSEHMRIAERHRENFREQSQIC